RGRAGLPSGQSGKGLQVRILEPQLRHQNPSRSAYGPRDVRKGGVDQLVRTAGGARARRLGSLSRRETINGLCASRSSSPPLDRRPLSTHSTERVSQTPLPTS